MDTSTDDGKEGFDIVRSTINKNVGYPLGHFPDAWGGLTDKFEEKDIVVVSHLKKLYYGTSMKIDEDPAAYIRELNEQRTRLASKQVKISDFEFVQDILENLPKSDDKRQMSPYQVVKKLIEGATEYGSQAYKLGELKTELNKVYYELYPEKKLVGTEADDSSSRGELGFPAYTKQFKGKCNRCGKIGHKGFQCQTNPMTPRQAPASGRGWNRGGRGAGRFSGRGIGGRLPIVCYYCKKPGHKEVDCFKKKRDQGGEKAFTAKGKKTEEYELAFTCASRPRSSEMVGT